MPLITTQISTLVIDITVYTPADVIIKRMPVCLSVAWANRMSWGALEASFEALPQVGKKDILS